MTSRSAVPRFLPFLLVAALAGCAADELAPSSASSPLEFAPTQAKWVYGLVHDESYPSYPEAATGADPNPNAHGLWLGNDVNPATCFRDLNPSRVSVTPDKDKDWLYDDCEFKIASGFRPFLFTGTMVGGCLEAEPYWAAKYFNYHPQGVRYVRVLYMMAYYKDCHWYDGHLGDGEFVQLNVAYDPASQHWLFHSITMSRHKSNPYYDWLNGNLSYGTETPGKWRGFPRLWVERTKHAHYPNMSLCDFPHECTSSSGARLAVFPDRNVGEVRANGDTAGVMPDPCPRSVRRIDPNLRECFIVDSSFTGWNGIPREGKGYYSDMKEWYSTFWDRMAPDVYVPGPGPEPPPPALSIDGPTAIAPYQNHTWTAQVNGVAPVSLQWYVDGAAAETSQSISRSWPANETHTLQVVANAGDGTSNSAVTTVQTYNYCAGGGAGCEEWLNIQGGGRATPLPSMPRKATVPVRRGIGR